MLPVDNVAVHGAGLRGKYEGQGGVSALELAETILQPPPGATGPIACSMSAWVPGRLLHAGQFTFQRHNQPSQAQDISSRMGCQEGGSMNGALRSQILLLHCFRRSSGSSITLQIGRQ